MRKVAVLGMCALICSQLVACGAKKDVWIETGTSMIGTNIDGGEIVIEGTSYTFPCEMSDLLNNGWHISNNYDNKDSFELESFEGSNTFEMYNEDSSKYIVVGAINMESESAKLADCSVESLKVLFSSQKDGLQVVLPSGISYKSTPDDVKAAYGEPDVVDDKEEIYYYNFNDKNDMICTAEITFVGDTIHSAKYYLSDDNWGSINSAEDCSQFVDDALKTSFYGDYARYVENKFDTEEAAIALYESEIEYYAESLMYFLGINTEVVDQAIIDQFYAISKDILLKTKWDEPVVELYGESSPLGTLTLTLYPLDFINIIVDDATTVNDDFAAKHAGTNFDALSDEEWAVLENEYANNILEAITPRVAEVSYLDPVEKTYDIDIDDQILNDDEWNEIDDIIMGFVEE